MTDKLVPTIVYTTPEGSGGMKMHTHRIVERDYGTGWHNPSYVVETRQNSRNALDEEVWLLAEDKCAIMTLTEYIRLLKKSNS